MSTERTEVHEHVECIEYVENGGRVWDFTPEAREWALDLRIEQLHHQEGEAETSSLGSFSA